MNAPRIRVLGPLSFSVDDAAEARLPGAVCQTIAILVAAGPYGLDRDQIANELWGQNLPSSWKSSLRNRFTAARRLFGPDAITNHSRRYALAAEVEVDSWELVERSRGLHAVDDPTLGFLVGEPFVGLKASPIMTQHGEAVVAARGALLRQALQRSEGAPGATVLQTLRDYQRAHPLDPVTTEEVVLAHLAAGDRASADEIVAATQTLASKEGQQGSPWIRQLLTVAGATSTDAPSDQDADVDSGRDGAWLRSDLFGSAVADEDWRLALEVAMSGLPEAERAHGDPDRIELLEAIPPDQLETEHQFILAITLARSLMLGGREDDALVWVNKARSLATTPSDELLAHITAALVGDIDDHRPLPLPQALLDLAHRDVNMASLQVAVVSHVERADYEAAAPVMRRFSALVEASGQPYRRWHDLLLAGMERFLEGDWDAASEISERAHKYGALFDIADADYVRLLQQHFANWVLPGAWQPGQGLPESPSPLVEPPTGLLRVLRAEPADIADEAEDWLRTWNLQSRSFNAVPSLVLLAPHVVALDLRAALRDRLASRSGTSAIFGTGVMHLGPVDRTLAYLVDDVEVRIGHLQAAVEVADRQRIRLWQIICRLELADATGDSVHLVDANGLATESVLKKVIEGHPKAHRTG